MPRPARLPPFPFGWYYIALRSVADRNIITSQADLVTVLNLLRVTLRERGGRLHAGYVAEREAHLVLQAGESPLTAIIGSFQHAYARSFNRTHGEHGSLFRLHHHVLLFQHQRWLVPLVHFVHWIRRLGVGDDCLGGLWWSSDAAYRGFTKLDWLTTNVVLRMLTRGTYSRQAQEEAYRRLFDRTPDPRHTRLFRRGSTEDPRLLGDAQFIAGVRRVSGKPLRDRNRRARNVEVDLVGVVVRVIEDFNAFCDERLPPREAGAWRRLVTYDNVCSKLRKRPLPMLRALIVSYVIQQKIATAAQAARFFGCGPRAVSACRRSFYEALFRERFAVSPETLLGARHGDVKVGRREGCGKSWTSSGAMPIAS